MLPERAPILAQKVWTWFRGFRPLLVGVLSIPLVIAFAAFGIAPDTITDTVRRVPVVEAVPLPMLAVDTRDDAFWHEAVIERGDTLQSVLGRLRVNADDTVAVIRDLRQSRLAYRLKSGHTLRVQATAAGKLLALRYRNGTQLLAADRVDEGFRCTLDTPGLESRVQIASGVIRSSLFAASDDAGLSDAVAVQIAEVFSTDIDFHRDLRKGDRFSAIFEMQYLDGAPVKPGRLLAAEFVNQGKAFHAVWFEVEAGQGGYYTLDGKNIRKAFLRSPLEFSRITSGYTNARYHPILQRWTAHRGIDYGAPTGTPVRTTGNGIIDFAGVMGGYGNLVVVRHQSSVTTYYGHLSRFGKGIHRGKRVSQGEVIGYVGSTGLSTGPHLHYEFRINNVHQNPLRLAMPPAPPLADKYRTAFTRLAEPYKAQLSLLAQLPPTPAD
jgi:murein DD-endopeptidase MepM/ murein hydrolase activator NlpD